jgi:sugar lactone lactonase YvrE
MTMETKVLLSGLEFPEGPRWRNEKLFFSDFIGRKVIAVDEKGKPEIITELQDSPSGLGFLNDGTMLIVSMTKRYLLRLDSEGLKIHADLSRFTEYNLNDSVTDSYGRTYIGNWGNKSLKSPAEPTSIILVTKEGNARIIADNLIFPNGCIVTPDCKTFIVAETFANKLTAYDIEESGNLINRRTWAELKDFTPDGICLDEEGGIWAANPAKAEVLRVLEGSEITSTIKVKGTNVYACALGGDDGKTLFLCTSQSIEGKRSSGRIECLKVEVPGIEIP